MTTPHIKTALPIRRYQLGSFLVNILGEIQSDDSAQYHFIMALLDEGEENPSLYVTAELNMPNQRSEGRYQVRVLLDNQEKVMGSGDEWGDIENFSLFSMGIAAKLYQLGDEEPRRLL
ncbi:hypothetical protein [Sedimenticola selenatireducens]|jgi:hypothetical protein|uniref:Uncharacterized protein n=1 Tax=Sedimenticola selenatireducens TaxID=191960 RepID=A0A558DL38_9GAMM|nr:hypothetical protein [Sedimenticola selenatireducens]TVO70057.1 hypothetical protein FHP88_17195 [Sedimenticola selenatireducens]TVT61701.1 MAG: hypothetical protein FHK78_16690 [Sedimenticola selenatireducens]